VHNVSDVRQVEVHTTELIVLDRSCLETEIAVVKLKKYKSPSSEQICTELIRAGGLSVIHKLVNSIWSEKELPDE
jgi:hypothetical protein